MYETPRVLAERRNRYFELSLTRSGHELLTDPIPFDAVALASEELPAVSTTDSLVMCENDAGNNDDECPDSRREASGSMQMKVRPVVVWGRSLPLGTVLP